MSADLFVDGACDLVAETAAEGLSADSVSAALLPEESAEPVPDAAPSVAEELSVPASVDDACCLALEVDAPSLAAVADSASTTEVADSEAPACSSFEPAPVAASAPSVSAVAATAAFGGRLDDRGSGGRS